jgi:hypothetical protein
MKSYREVERRLERLEEEQEARRAAEEGAPLFVCVPVDVWEQLHDPTTPAEVCAELEAAYGLDRGPVKVYAGGFSPDDWGD